ncbi:MAG: helix-turn-helix domain-containing protein [Nitrospirota bacterium]
MVVKRLIENLMYTGLTEYEAKAYMGLLVKSPATAYELAKESGIPTSKIYEVLSRLEEKGVALPTGAEGGRRYIPMEPEEFVESRRFMMEATLQYLRNDLGSTGAGQASFYIWHIGEYGPLLDKARRMAGGAARTLLLSLWAEEMEALEGPLRDALGRGVKVASLHFGVPAVRVGQVFSHPIQGIAGGRKRSFVMVSDSREAVTAAIARDGSVEGAGSANRGFVALAEEYVRHDIYMMKIARRFGPGLTRAFGGRFEKLRDVFSDEEAG